MIREVLQRFISLLDEQRFYEAHEVIEEVWFDNRFLDCNEVRLQKGLINAAVSFELLKKGKISQSKKVYKTYLKYRQLLFKIDSKNINAYYMAVRYVDNNISHF